MEDKFILERKAYVNEFGFQEERIRYSDDSLVILNAAGKKTIRFNHVIEEMNDGQIRSYTCGVDPKDIAWDRKKYIE